MPQHHIFLGNTGRIPYELSVNISAIASLSLQDNLPDLTLTADASLSVSVTYFLNESITLTADTTVDCSGGFDVFNTLTITANALADANNGDQYFDTLTITADNTLTADISNLINSSIVLTANITLARVLEFIRFATASLTANTTISTIGGYDLLNTLELDVIASITLLPGIGYNDTITLTADNSITPIDLIQIGNVLTISAVADFSIVQTLDPGGLLTISAAANVTSSSLQDFSINLPIQAIALFYPENIFDFVTSQNDAFASLTAANDYIAGAPFAANVAASVTVGVTGVYNKSIQESITFIENIIVGRPNINVFDSLTFIENVKVQKIVIRTKTDYIYFTDSAYRILPVIDSITFTDSAHVYRVRKRIVNETLLFNDLPNRLASYNLRISDNVLFGEGKNYTSPLNGQIIQIPPIVVNLIHGKCKFVLTVYQRSILLPCPLWGDQQNLLGQVVIKRTVTGDTYSYIKQTDLRKLQYVFSVDTQKRIELYEFVKSFSDEYITIDNHKGEKWKAQLANNPFQFESRSRYEPRRERFDVTLEFEGVRIG